MHDTLNSPPAPESPDTPSEQTPQPGRQNVLENFINNLLQSKPVQDVINFLKNLVGQETRQELDSLHQQVDPTFTPASPVASIPLSERAVAPSEETELVAAAAAEIIASNEILASDFETEFAVLGDSHVGGVGMSDINHRIFRNGATTTKQLELFREALSAGRLRGVKSCAMMGVGNNFTAFGAERGLEVARRDVNEFIRLCRENGIQPVLCTMIEGISDEPENVPPVSERASNPRIRFIRDSYNPMIIEMARQNTIPVVNLNGVPVSNPDGRVHLRNYTPIVQEFRRLVEKTNS